MTTSIEKQWPWLCWFSQAYFDEDWPDDFERPSDVIDAFLDKGQDFAGEVAAEIHLALALYAEDDLAQFFASIDLLLDPAVDLNTYRGWLSGVARRLNSGRVGPARTGPSRPLNVASSDDTRQRWPGLAALGSDYFASGWEHEAYWSTRLVVEKFMAERPELAAALPAEIESVLASYREEELAAVLRSLGFTYNPTEALNTNRGWLTEVARRVQQRLDEQR